MLSRERRPEDATLPKRRVYVLLPDLDRTMRIGEFWSNSQSRAFAELLMNARRTERSPAVPAGMLREGSPA